MCNRKCPAWGQNERSFRWSWVTDNQGFVISLRMPRKKWGLWCQAKWNHAWYVTTPLDWTSPCSWKEAIMVCFRTVHGAELDLTSHPQYRSHRRKSCTDSAMFSAMDTPHSNVECTHPWFPGGPGDVAPAQRSRDVCLKSGMYPG